MEPDLVSVIIPTFNRSGFLEKCFGELSKQRHKNLEILLVDNQSTDDTFPVFQKMEKQFPDLRLNYLMEPRKGACFARNTGLAHAKGPFLQYLDVDDFLHPDKIALQVALAQRTGADVVFSDFAKVDETGKTLKEFVTELPVGDFLASVKSLSVMNPLIRVNPAVKSIAWNTELPSRQDLDYMFRIFLSTENWVYLPGVYCYYLVHAGPKISDHYQVDFPAAELIESVHRQRYAALNPDKKRYIRTYTRTLFNWASARGQGKTIKKQVLKYGFKPPLTFSSVKNSLALLLK